MPNSLAELNAQNQAIVTGLNATSFATKALLSHGVTIDKIIIEKGRPVIIIQDAHLFPELKDKVISSHVSSGTRYFTASLNSANVRWQYSELYLAAVNCGTAH